jgi:hypothetical protein
VSDDQPVVRTDTPSRETQRRPADLGPVEADHDAASHHDPRLVEIAARSRARTQLPKAALMAVSGGMVRLWSRTLRYEVTRSSSGAVPSRRAAQRIASRACSSLPRAWVAMSTTLRPGAPAANSRDHPSLTGETTDLFPHQDRFVIAYVVPIPAAPFGGTLGHMIATPPRKMRELHSRTGGEDFTVKLREGDRPLDVFHHPYAYAAARSAYA